MTHERFHHSCSTTRWIPCQLTVFLLVSSQLGIPIRFVAGEAGFLPPELFTLCADILTLFTAAIYPQSYPSQLPMRQTTRKPKVNARKKGLLLGTLEAVNAVGAHEGNDPMVYGRMGKDFAIATATTQLRERMNYRSYVIVNSFDGGLQVTSFDFALGMMSVPETGTPRKAQT